MSDAPRRSLVAARGKKGHARRKEEDEGHPCRNSLSLVVLFTRRVTGGVNGFLRTGHGRWAAYAALERQLIEQITKLGHLAFQAFPPGLRLPDLDAHGRSHQHCVLSGIDFQKFAKTLRDDKPSAAG